MLIAWKRKLECFRASIGRYFLVGKTGESPFDTFDEVILTQCEFLSHEFGLKLRFVEFNFPKVWNL